MCFGVNPPVEVHPFDLRGRKRKGKQSESPTGNRVSVRRGVSGGQPRGGGRNPVRIQLPVALPGSPLPAWPSCQARPKRPRGGQRRRGWDLQEPESSLNFGETVGVGRGTPRAGSGLSRAQEPKAGLAGKAVSGEASRRSGCGCSVQVWLGALGKRSGELVGLFFTVAREVRKKFVSLSPDPPTGEKTTTTTNNQLSS